MFNVRSRGYDLFGQNAKANSFPWEFFKIRAHFTNSQTRQQSLDGKICHNTLSFVISFRPIFTKKILTLFIDYPIFCGNPCLVSIGPKKDSNVLNCMVTLSVSSPSAYMNLVVCLMEPTSSKRPRSDHLHRAGQT